MIKLIVKNNEAGKRVNKYVQNYLANANTSFIYKMFRKKNILLNDRKIEGSEILKTGDTISIFFSDETIKKFTSKTIERINEFKDITEKPDIVYENEDYIIVDKPIGILSQKSKSDDISINEICLKYLYDKNEINDETLKIFRPSIVNRLDKDTYGLLIFSKNYKASKLISEKLKNRNGIDKYYLAIVNGVVDIKKETINAFIFKDNIKNKVFVSDVMKDGYSENKTEYEVIDKNEELSLLRIKLITGKTHQIRAHFAYLGYPLLGDKKYMNDKMYQDNIKKYNIRTQALLSKELVFDGKIFCSKYNLELPK